MSEKITIKISAEMLSEKDAKTVTREIDIEINQNATVNDLIKKSKNTKSLLKDKNICLLSLTEKF